MAVIYISSLKHRQITDLVSDYNSFIKSLYAETVIDITYQTHPARCAMRKTIIDESARGNIPLSSDSENEEDMPTNNVINSDNPDAYTTE